MMSKTVPLFLGALRHRGIEYRELMLRFLLPEESIDSAEVRVSLTTLLTVTEECARLANDPLLGFHVGATLERGAYGVIEFAVRSVSTLDDALNRLVRYGTLVSELVLLELEPTRGTLRLHHTVPGEAQGFGPQVNEFFLGLCVHVTRQLAGADFKPLSAWLAHPASRLGEIEKFVGCSVTAGAGRNGLAFARADLTRSVTSSDPALLTVLDHHAAQAASARPRGTGLMPQVRELLREVLPHGGAAIERVAARMHMSSRTLQRRLAQEGASFQVLSEQLRQELAVQLVAERQRSLGEISYMLGYSDLRAFARAYRRWTGTTPGAARDAASS